MCEKVMCDLPAHGLCWVAPGGFLWGRPHNSSPDMPKARHKKRDMDQRAEEVFKLPDDDGAKLVCVASGSLALVKSDPTGRTTKHESMPYCQQANIPLVPWEESFQHALLRDAVHELEQGSAMLHANANGSFPGLFPTCWDGMMFE
jgi:hypothetical protein